jgi:hypothetical protein
MMQGVMNHDDDFGFPFIPKKCDENNSKYQHGPILKVIGVGLHMSHPQNNPREVKKMLRTAWEQNHGTMPMILEDAQIQSRHPTHVEILPTTCTGRCGYMHQLEKCTSLHFSFCSSSNSLIGTKMCTVD